MANLYQDFEVLQGGVCLAPSDFPNSVKSLWLRNYTKVVSKITGVRELTKYAITGDFLLTDWSFTSFGFIFGYRKKGENGGQEDSFYFLYAYPRDSRIYFKKQLNEGSIINIRDDYFNSGIFNDKVAKTFELIWNGNTGDVEFTIENQPIFSANDTSFEKGGWGFYTGYTLNSYFVLDNITVYDVD